MSLEKKTLHENPLKEAEEVSQHKLHLLSLFRRKKCQQNLEVHLSCQFSHLQLETITFIKVYLLIVCHF